MRPCKAGHTPVELARFPADQVILEHGMDHNRPAVPAVQSALDNHQLPVVVSCQPPRVSSPVHMTISVQAGHNSRTALFKLYLMPPARYSKDDDLVELEHRWAGPIAIRQGCWTPISMLTR